MSVSVEKAVAATPELLAGLNNLLPQLSSNAVALSLVDVETMVNSDAATLFVATDNGVVVGTLTLVIFPIPTGVRAWIEDVVVDENARGLGIGEALTSAAVDEARRRSVRSIDLTSRPSREVANALYRKLGFERRET
ncbi:MAG TPA: GNAT family N-acetyltransferase, partial [Acidimicrobiales bacterium]|nr:GNAT family N-acetyltransferase [Acidimicrobiales bacterium]